VELSSGLLFQAFPLLRSAPGTRSPRPHFVLRVLRARSLFLFVSRTLFQLPPSFTFRGLWMQKRFALPSFFSVLAIPLSFLSWAFPLISSRIRSAPPHGPTSPIFTPPKWPCPTALLPHVVRWRRDTSEEVLGRTRLVPCISLSLCAQFGLSSPFECSRFFNTSLSTAIFAPNFSRWSVLCRYLVVRTPLRFQIPRLF